MRGFSLKKAALVAWGACLFHPGGAAFAASPAKALACPRTPFAQLTSLPQVAQAIICDNAGRQLIIVGDYHGSNEIPAFVGRLMETASARRPVRLGLEMEAFEQDPIGIFMKSHGTVADRAALLHDGYWSTGQGRTSQAIARLIEHARDLRAQGRDVDVFTMLAAYPGDAVIEQAGGITAYWNQGIAESIRRRLASAPAGALVIAFMGQAHAAFTQPAKASDATATDRLLPDSPYLVEMAVHGQTWSCSREGCGPHEVVGNKPAATGPGILEKVDRMPGAPETVQVRLPALTPSPPAKAKAEKPSP